jgi:hypothetical protein
MSPLRNPARDSEEKHVANAYRAYRTIERRRCRQIMVGSVPVGGDAPISVQTMTNSLTTDVKATLAQIDSAAEAGRGYCACVLP